VDNTRCLLWVLLPICIVGSLVFVSQGVVQNLKTLHHGAVDRTPNVRSDRKQMARPSTQIVTQQVSAQGPVASQEVIKEFGTNVVDFLVPIAPSFRKSHAFSNFFQLVLIFAIPSGLTYTLRPYDWVPAPWLAVWRR